MNIEEQNTQKQKGEGQEEAVKKQGGETTKAPSIDEISKVAREAALAAVEEAKQQSPGISKEEIQSLIKEQEKIVTQGIVDRIQGKEPEKKASPYLEKFVTDTEGFLEGLIDVAKEEVMREFQTKAQARSDLQNTLQQTLGDRPDILKASPEHMKIFSTFVQSVDADLPMEKRLKEAVKGYDRFIESLGGGDADKRISEAASTSANASSGGRSSSGATKERLTEADIRAIQEKDLKAEYEHYKQRTGNRAGH